MGCLLVYVVHRDASRERLILQVDRRQHGWDCLGRYRKRSGCNLLVAILELSREPLSLRRCQKQWPCARDVGLMECGELGPWIILRRSRAQRIAEGSGIREIARRMRGKPAFPCQSLLSWMYKSTRNHDLPAGTRSTEKHPWMNLMRRGSVAIVVHHVKKDTSLQSDYGRLDLAFSCCLHAQNSSPDCPSCGPPPPSSASLFAACVHVHEYTSSRLPVHVVFSDSPAAVRALHDSAPLKTNVTGSSSTV